jgi:putative transcriptional regulator
VSKKPTSTKIARTRGFESTDPDNPPLSLAQLRSMKRVAPVKRIRWQLGLSQEDFARRFEIPIGTVRDWEQGRSRPDRAAAAYLKIIGSDPASVGRALRTQKPVSSRVSSLASKALSNPSSLTRNEVRDLAASVLTQVADTPRSRKKS